MNGHDNSTSGLDRRQFLAGSMVASIAAVTMGSQGRAATGTAPVAAGAPRASRLRHYVIATDDRDFVCDQLYEFLGMPALPKSGPDRTIQYGFYSTMMKVGTAMLEVVQPARPDFHLVAWLAKRGGAGGYMVVGQTWDGKALAARGRAANLQLNRDQLFLGQHQVQFDEKDFGAFFEFYQYAPEDDWWGNPLTRPYGESRVASDIVASVVAVEQPQVVATRAAEVFTGRLEGTTVHFLDRKLTFSPSTASRHGLVELHLVAKQPNRVGDWARIAGVQLRLV